MDNETRTYKTNTKAASSEAPTTTNTPKAASSDAPNTKKPSSQEAPKRQPPKAASSDKTNKPKRSAASKDAMRKATARSAPNQAASQAPPTPSTSKDAPHNTTLNTRPRAVLEHGDSKRSADEDAPKTRAASTAAVSERDLTSLAEAPLTGTQTSNTPTTTWKTVTRKTSSKRRLPTLAEARRQDDVANTATHCVQPLACGSPQNNWDTSRCGCHDIQIHGDHLHPFPGGRCCRWGCRRAFNFNCLGRATIGVRATATYAFPVAPHYGDR